MAIAIRLLLAVCLLTPGILLVNGQRRCGLSSVELGITNTGKKFGYDPIFEVVVKNTCRCTLINVFLRPEGFASSMKVDPMLFRRDGNDYLVNDGKGIPSTMSVKFQYAWDRAFNMTPSSVRVACRSMSTFV